MELAALFLRNWGAGGLVAMCVILVLFGKLVPRSIVDDLRKDRDEWRDAALTALAQAEKLAELADRTKEIHDTTGNILTVVRTTQSSLSMERRST